MKKDRDCSQMSMAMPYMGPMMGFGMPVMPMGVDMNTNINSNTPNYTGIDNNLYNQINALEKRVSNLEAMISNTNYNNSTYQMM